MCEEPFTFDLFLDTSPTPIYTPEGPKKVHRSCMLREVLGGIGHLIAHEYWCEQKHDPDAGLTRRQSALLVRHFYSIVGIPDETPEPSP